MIGHIKEEIKMTIEKILEIKDELVKRGIVDEPIIINDSKFLKIFEKLKEWFKWDIQRFPYKELTDPIGYRYNYRDCDLKFYNENYDLITFSVMVGINICGKKGVLNDVEDANAILGFSFTSFTALEDSYFYKNYQKICGINTEILGFFIGGMIRNKMGNGTFEEFLNDYATILQKYKPVPLIDKDGTIETTATHIVEPKYTPGSNRTMEQIKSQYGYYVPAAYSALQNNPVGLWYMHPQTGQYRSEFIDYDNKAFYCYYYQDLINNINKVLSNPSVYEEILKQMPIIGTKFANVKPVLLQFLGFSKSTNAYVLGACYGNHTFIIKVNIKDSKIDISYGVNDEINQKIDDYLNE